MKLPASLKHEYWCTKFKKISKVILEIVNKKLREKIILILQNMITTFIKVLNTDLF